MTVSMQASVYIVVEKSKDFHKVFRGATVCAIVVFVVLRQMNLGLFK